MVFIFFSLYANTLLCFINRLFSAGKQVFLSLLVTKAVLFQLCVYSFWTELAFLSQSFTLHPHPAGRLQGLQGQVDVLFFQTSPHVSPQLLGRVVEEIKDSPFSLPWAEEPCLLGCSDAVSLCEFLRVLMESFLPLPVGSYLCLAMNSLLAEIQMCAFSQWCAGGFFRGLQGPSSAWFPGMVIVLRLKLLLLLQLTHGSIHSLLLLGPSPKWQLFGGRVGSGLSWFKPRQIHQNHKTYMKNCLNKRWKCRLPHLIFLYFLPHFMSLSQEPEVLCQFRSWLSSRQVMIAIPQLSGVGGSWTRHLRLYRKGVE